MLNDVELTEWRGIYVRADNTPDSRPGLYVLINKVNGKRYVGISQNVRRRLREHTAGNGCVPILSKAFRKYGNGAFVAIPLLYSIDGTDHLPELEAAFIAELDTIKRGYNVLAAWGGVGPYGEKFSEIMRTVQSDPDLKERLALKKQELWSQPGYREWAAAIAKEVQNRPERKKAASVHATHMHKNRSPDERTRINASISASHSTKAAKAHRSKISKQKWADPELRAKITEGITNAFSTPEYKAEQSKRMKSILSDPKVKEKQRNGIANAVARRGKGFTAGYAWITNGELDTAIRKNEEIPEGWRRGRSNYTKSEKVTTKGLMWITNGVDSKFVNPTVAIPSGWRRGRTRPLPR